MPHKNNKDRITTQLKSLHETEMQSKLWISFRVDPAHSAYPTHGNAWAEFIYTFSGYKGQTCYGRDLRLLDDEEIIRRGVDLSYVIDAYNLMGRPGDEFFTPMFEKLIGRSYVREMIKEGKSAEEIKATWAQEVEEFKKLRRRYLLYAE